MNFDKWLGREYRGVTVQQKRRSIRFRAPGQADKSAWTVFQVEGSDCLLFVHPEAQRRRLTPVPSGWQQFGEAELADLLNRATPAPVSLMTRIRKRTVKPSALPVQQRHDELLALEHEQRLTTEQLLDEAHAALKGMEGDLQSAHAELRVMDEELQEMAETIRKLTRTPSLEPAPEPRTQKEAGRIASPSKGRRSRPETHQRST